MACKKRKNPQKISAVRSGGGYWIWLDNEISPDSYGEFFEEIEISHSVSVRLRISCDSNYAVYINDALAAFGQYADYTEIKDTILIEKLTLHYEQITDDPDYANISGAEYPYEPRGAEDFQIGRLVRVVPKITPQDASYKTLDYSVVKGGEYIQDFATSEESGITYAQFRVKNDVANIGKAIQISATSNGYTGEYADDNVTGTSEKDLIITEIPADDFVLGIQEASSLKEIGTSSQSVYVPVLSVSFARLFPPPVCFVLVSAAACFTESGGNGIMEENGKRREIWINKSERELNMLWNRYGAGRKQASSFCTDRWAGQCSLSQTAWCATPFWQRTSCRRALSRSSAISAVTARALTVTHGCVASSETRRSTMCAACAAGAGKVWTNLTAQPNAVSRRSRNPFSWRNS